MPTVLCLWIFWHGSLFFFPQHQLSLYVLFFPVRIKELRISVTSPGVLSSDSQNITDRVDSSNNELICFFQFQTLKRKVVWTRSELWVWHIGGGKWTHDFIFLSKQVLSAKWNVNITVLVVSEDKGKPCLQKKGYPSFLIRLQGIRIKALQ